MLKSIPLQLMIIAPLPMSSTRPPPTPTQVFQLEKDKVKELKAFLMSKGNPTSGKKDELLANVKYLIRDAETFTVEYSS